MGQRQLDVVVEDIFAAGKTTSFAVVATDQPRYRFLDEEATDNHKYKYLAFSLNFSSNCDYNNR